MALPKHTPDQLALVLRAISVEINNPKNIVVLVGKTSTDMYELNKLFVHITSMEYRVGSNIRFRVQGNKLVASHYIFIE